MSCQISSEDKSNESYTKEIKFNHKHSINKDDLDLIDKESKTDESEHKNDVSHESHHELFQLPKWFQNIISILVILLILFIANYYDNLRIVNT